METELTFGQKAVGLKFNPSNDDEVGQCKQKFADLIDQQIELHDKAQQVNDQETVELTLDAIRFIKTAQMWAVKAITWKYNK